MIAANRSAPIVPATRSVRCTLPVATTAVRATAPGPPPPSLGAAPSRLKYSPAPATSATTIPPQIRPFGRGFGGTGLTIAGRDGGWLGSAPPNGLDADALIMFIPNSLRSSVILDRPPGSLQLYMTMSFG
jgi:hypothetical protein